MWAGITCPIFKKLIEVQLKIVKNFDKISLK